MTDTQQRDPMVLVVGHLEVDAEGRSTYLDGCRDVVAAARRAPGCLEFALCADLLDPRRIQVVERWKSRVSLEAFRGDGVEEGQAALIRHAEVAEYDVAASRSLT